MATRNLTGQVFGRLTVQERGPSTDDHLTRWFCHCICGTQTLVMAQNLLNQKRGTRSCGCARKQATTDFIAKLNYIDGRSHTAEYEIWLHIKDRCLKVTNPAYPRYGGRGIIIEWDSFEAFLVDMGPRPSTKHSIERQDNDGPYSKANCIWATPSIQARNRRSNLLLTYNGVTQCLQDWAQQLDLPYQTLNRRWHLGWTHDDILTVPIHPGQKHQASKRNNKTI